MNKQLNFLQSKWVKTLVIGGCIAAFSGGAAYADTAPDTPVSTQVIQPADIPQAILDLQADVDRFLFEEHADQLKERGITVTHTSPMDGYVEIGITPYDEANAAYLLEQLGDDRVKVVEGQQAVLFVPEPMLDGQPVPDQAPELAANITAATGAEVQAQTVSATDVSAPAAPMAERTLPAYVYGMIAAAAALAAAGVLAIRRLASRRQ
jgi:hypothetical protein